MPKRPRAARELVPKQEHRPRALAKLLTDEGKHSNPVFCFARVDTTYIGEWGWNLLEAEHDLLGLMFTWSQNTWNELRSHRGFGGHRLHHWQPISTLTPTAQERLADLRWDEDRIFRFRDGATKRLWGFEFDGVFYPVWWDPNHKVYPTEPD